MKNNKIWSIITGSVFIIFGALILLHNLNIIYFRDAWRLFWPIILIIIGLIFVFRKYSPNQFSHHHVSDSEDKNEEFEAEHFSKPSEGDFHQSNVFGDVRFSSSTKEYPGGNINNVFGDIIVDLRKIDFSNGTRVLLVSGIFGSINVKLPPSIPVKVSVNTIAGSVKFLNEKKDGILINLNSQSPDYETSNKKLQIKASLIFGDIRFE